ncbi:MAG: outer membrane protein assembly factor BamB family protein [Planctomycetota bacterium]|jgi:outer membrane protein assembly factor BamB/tetratricopeptide (TPR) repeat protein
MALKGDLASVDLAQVFQMLALNQKVGILNIQGPKAWRALYFGPQGTTLFYNEHVFLDRVLLQMTRTGRLAAQSVQEARDHAAQQGLDLIGSLLAGGYLTEVDLESAFRLEIEEEIYDLFFWHDAQFEFYEGATSIPGREGLVDERFFFSTDSLIMEAARRIDEWAYIQERVPGPLEVYQVCQNVDAQQLDEYALAVFDLADGKRNISRLTEITGMPAFQVYKAMSCLLEEGLVSPVPEDQLLHSARESVTEGRSRDAINLYEKAIDVGEGIPDAHGEVAEVYEQVHEFELAAYHLKCVAEYHAGSDHLPQAVETFFSVVQLLPTDLAARERLVELTAGRSNLSGGAFEPVAFGKELVDLYLEIGEVERVRGILEKLLRDNPNDVELKKSLINVHTKVGDTKRVVDLYHSMAEDLVQQRNPIEAIKYLQKILMIDRSRKDISERIRSLYQLDERRRSRRRSLVALGLLFFLLSCMAAGYYYYDEYARKRLVGMQGAIDPLVEARHFVAAIAKLEQFKKNYPLTLVTKQAQAEIGRIEVKRRKYEAEKENDLRQKRQQLESIRFQYQEKWDEFEVLVKSRRLDAALRILEEVQVLVDEAGTPQDRNWSKKVKLAKNRADLEGVMSRALALDRDAWAAWEKGDWQSARKLWKELVSEYEMTTTAEGVRLPVQIQSRPSGAQIFFKGEPLMLEVNGEQVPAVTPKVVLCDRGASEDYSLDLAGFLPEAITVVGEESSVSTTILTIVPSFTFSFIEPLQSTASARHGYLGMGLIGGKVAFAGVTSGKIRTIISLPDLDEIAGAPAFSVDRAFFTTKRGLLQAYSLPNGERRWSKNLGGPVLLPPVVIDGRVFVMDDEGVLLALDASDGRQLWSQKFSTAAAAQPAVTGPKLRVGLEDGQVLILDTRNGKLLRSYQHGAGVSTQVYGLRNTQVFGTDDGQVVALRESDGQSVWQYGLKRSVDQFEMVLDDGAVFVLDGSDKLIKLVEGRKMAEIELPGRRISGPVVAGEKIFISVRRRVEQAAGEFEEEDLLLALDKSDFSALWEFEDGGLFRGPILSDGASVFVPNAQSEVLLFK